MTHHIDNIYFQVLYAVSAILVLMATIQTFRYAHRHPSWGSWTVAVHFATKTLFVIDLFLLRSIWTGASDQSWGANGLLTFGIRLVWVGTMTAMMVAVSLGSILPDGVEAPWDGSDRRNFIRRAEDRV